MLITNKEVAELVAMPIASFPGSRMSREEIIAHLDSPVCGIMAGVREHLKAIGFVEMWRLCYALKCDSPEALIAVMWGMIKKRKRKDSTWQNYLPAQRDGS